MPIFANNHSLSIMAITKAVIAVIIVGTVAYCMITETPIEDELIKVVLLIIGGYFGYSAKVYSESQRWKWKVYQNMYKTIKELQANASE